MIVRALRFLCLIAASLAAPAIGAPAMTAGNPELIKELVDIGGGRRLNMVCVGKGSPTVIFEQGWGGGIRDWRKVQQPISALTRACFYDRAGNWWSDPGARPSTADNVTDDLRALLRKGGVAQPVVLVGHSLGGLFATLYADRFPKEVAGLVLVDPSYSSQQQSPDNIAKAVTYLRRCATLAREGKLSVTDPHHCFDTAPVGYTADEVAFLMPQALRPFRYDAQASEMEMMPESREQERRAARGFGDMPVIVMTHDLFLPIPGQSEVAQKAYNANLKQARDQLAARSSRGQSIIVAGAGHYIQEDRPQAVVDAVRQVVLEVRQRH
jgi:pimeloyl-ACP methyl ester carboxylesterase